MSNHPPSFTINSTFAFDLFDLHAKEVLRLAKLKDRQDIQLALRGAMQLYGEFCKVLYLNRPPILPEKQYEGAFSTIEMILGLEEKPWWSVETSQCFMWFHATLQATSNWLKRGQLEKTAALAVVEVKED